MSDKKNNVLNKINKYSNEEIITLNSNYEIDFISPNKEYKKRVLNNAFVKPKLILKSLDSVNFDIKNKINQIKYLKSLQFNKVYKTLTFNELVIYWQNNIQNLPDKLINNKKRISNIKPVEQYSESGENIFFILEFDKLMLLFNSDHQKPTICPIRNEVYREALMIACFQDAIKIALIDLGIKLSEYMHKKLLFPKYIFEWGYIKSIIYQNEDSTPRILTDQILQHLQEADIKERVDRYVKLEESTIPNYPKPRSYDSLSDLKDAKQWVDVEINLKMVIAGSFAIRVKLKKWNTARDYSLSDFALVDKEGKLISDGMNLLIIANEGYYEYQSENIKSSFNRLNKLFQNAFGIKDDAIHYKPKLGYTHNFSILKIDGLIDYNHPSQDIYYQQAISLEETPKRILFEEIKTLNIKYQSDEELKADEHQNLINYWEKFIRPLKGNYLPCPPENYKKYLEELNTRIDISKTFKNKLNHI